MEVKPTSLEDLMEYNREIDRLLQMGDEASYEQAMRLRHSWYSEIMSFEKFMITESFVQYKNAEWIQKNCIDVMRLMLQPFRVVAEHLKRWYRPHEYPDMSPIQIRIDAGESWHQPNTHLILGDFRRIISWHERQPLPRKVCLCGSTRFSEAYQQANLEETLAGNIVLTIGCDMKSDAHLFENMTEAERDQVKQRLDQLHLHKIRDCDEVLVLNVGGYIGESTRREIAFAKSILKPVRYLEPVENVNA